MDPNQPPPPSDGVRTRARARLRLETPLKECIGDKSMEQETVSRYIYLKQAMDWWGARTNIIRERKIRKGMNNGYRRTHTWLSILYLF